MVSKELIEDFMSVVETGNELAEKFGYKVNKSHVDDRIVIGVEEYDDEGNIIKHYIGFVAFREMPPLE